MEKDISYTLNEKSTQMIFQFWTHMPQMKDTHILKETSLKPK